MKLLAERDLSELLGVNRATLRRWREDGTGPLFVRLGSKLIRYREDDLTAFLDRRSGGEPFPEDRIQASRNAIPGAKSVNRPGRK